MRLSHWCFLILVLQGFHDDFNVFLGTLILITSKGMQPVSYLPWLNIGTSGHFEAFNCFWLVGRRYVGLKHLLDREAAFREKTFPRELQWFRTEAWSCYDLGCFFLLVLSRWNNQKLWLETLYHEEQSDSNSSGKISPCKDVKFSYGFWWVIIKLFSNLPYVYSFSVWPVGMGSSSSFFSGVRIELALAFFENLSPSHFLLESLKFYLIKEYLNHLTIM